MATSVIGLDIGTTRVRAVELQRTRGQAVVVQYGEEPLPVGAVRDGEVVETPAVAAALRQLWTRAKFSHRRVVLGVGNQRVMVRPLELPAMPLAQLRGSLPFQVQDILPVAVEDALLDFYPTGQVDGPNGATALGLLVAATKDTVHSNVTAVESAGLQPLMVDLNGFALLRAQLHGPLNERTVALVDIGARITTVVVADQGVPRLVRILAVGGHSITDGIASAMSVTLPEAEQIKREITVGQPVRSDLAEAGEAAASVVQNLVEAVRNTFVYYSGNNPGRPISEVLVTGGGAHMSGLGQYLASASRLPVSLGNPLAGVSVKKGTSMTPADGSISGLAVSMGLAMAEVAA